MTAGLTFAAATPEDAAAIAALRTAVAERLTREAVQPDHQRQRIGRRLLDFAIEATRAWPAEAIRLDAYDGPAGAGGFYARCGFREVGRVVYRGTPLVYFELVV